MFKRILFLFFMFTLLSCRLDVIEEVTSSYAKSKGITVNLDFPDGCYAYPLVYTNLSKDNYVVISSGDTIYSTDSGVIVRAIGTYGYIFDSWVGDDIADRRTNTTSVLLDKDKTITGKFIVDPNPTRITLRKRVTGGGEIYVGINFSEYEYNGDIYISGIAVGTELIIKATAYEGYEFVEWIGNGIRELNKANTYVKLKGNTTIEAIFCKK